jgi:hypothetical protein
MWQPEVMMDVERMLVNVRPDQAGEESGPSGSQAAPREQQQQLPAGLSRREMTLQQQQLAGPFSSNALQLQQQLAGPSNSNALQQQQPAGEASLVAAMARPSE